MHDIMSAIRRACADHGIPTSRFGREAVHDPRLVHDLELGRQLRSETQAKVTTFIAQLGRA